MVFIVTLAIVYIFLPTLTHTCATEHDCSLNGQCIGITCFCDPGWTGDSCAILNLLPAKKETGYQNLTYASWGGSPLLGTDGRYHLYTAQFLNQCPLDSWRTNSVIIRAVSDKIVGPYVYAETVLPPWGHNPMPIRAPDGMYLIYHIGDGSPTGPIENCTGDGRSGNRKWTRAGEGARGGAERRGRKMRTELPKDGDEIRVNILYSQFPDGGWQQYNEIYEDPADNPAPYFFPNGTVLLLHRMDIWANFTDPISYILLAIAKHWTGPYITQGGPIFIHQCEDPFIYRNQRGHFHALFHGMEEGYTDQKTYAGRHAFSRDGLRWSFSDIPAYNSSIVFEGGETVVFGRRERPQLLFENGVPRYLWNGVEMEGEMSQTFVQEIKI